MQMHREKMEVLNAEQAKAVAGGGIMEQMRIDLIRKLLLASLKYAK